MGTQSGVSSAMKKGIVRVLMTKVTAFFDLGRHFKSKSSRGTTTQDIQARECSCIRGDEAITAVILPLVSSHLMHRRSRKCHGDKQALGSIHV